MKSKVIRIIGINENLHRELKMMCVRLGISMNDHIKNLIKISVEMDRERRS